MHLSYISDQEKDKEITKLKSDIKQYKTQVADLTIQLENAVEEREFSFSKIKEVEFYVDSLRESLADSIQAPELKTVLLDIHKILCGDEVYYWPAEL